MAPKLRVQVILKNSKNQSLMADAHPKGLTRGLASAALSYETFQVCEDTRCQVIRILPNQQLHQGITSVECEQGVSGALTQYMLSSEQVTSTIAVANQWQEDELICAGGLLVQLLPEANRETLETLTKTLERLHLLEDQLLQSHCDPHEMIQSTLEPFPHTILDETDVYFGCTCSETRVLGALGTLPREEIQEMSSSNAVINIECDYCQKEYHISSLRLQSLLTSA